LVHVEEVLALCGADNLLALVVNWLDYTGTNGGVPDGVAYDGLCCTDDFEEWGVTATWKSYSVSIEYYRDS
jgi:hypothetical protein